MNKPVAWMDDFGNVFECENKLFYIPLYTNSVKELTDEEILNMAADKFHYSEYRLVVEFARAILRKAQKK